MDPIKPTKKRTPEVPSDNDFYETMPMSIGSNYVYRDDVFEQYRGVDDRVKSDYEATVKRVAIITLIIAAAMAIAAAIVIAQGVSVIQNTMPVNQTSSGSLEL